MVADAEVLVIISGTSPGPRRHSTDSRAVRFVRCLSEGAGAARNVALREARHDIVLFTDDDCEVSPSWCAALAAELGSGAVAAVASPVDVPALGPVTAFLDYQRIFDAPPVDAERVWYPITASCGVRRDLLPARVVFPEKELAGAGGEDAELGYRLGDAGLAIAWKGEIPPTKHLLSEQIAQLTERFLRYGRANATLVHRFGRWRESVPGVLDWYVELTSATGDDSRRFVELSDPSARICFTAFEALIAAAFLVGYLEQSGHELGQPLVVCEHEELARAWRSLADEATAAAGPAGWRAVDADIGRLRGDGGGTRDRATERWLAEVAATQRADLGASLRLHAPLVGTPAPDVVAALRRFAPAIDEEQAAATGCARTVRAGLDAASCGLRDLRRRLRAAGLTTRDGLHDIELMCLSTTIVP